MQVIFNDKKSYDDIRIVVENISIQPPSKKKIKVSVPFMNGSYDFSTLGSSGEIVYGERIIKIRFNFVEKSRGLLYIKYSKVMEWLLDSVQSKLIFSDMPDYYFLAEVENAPSFEEVIRRAGKFEVEFIAEPFKIGVDYATNNLWDTFNFEEDYLQDSDYDVVGTRTITLYNPGRIVTPIINCNAATTLTYNSKVYNLVVGDNKLYGFKLQNGANNIIINGTGHIKILFRKVAI